jgi:hypothetical protein
MYESLFIDIAQIRADRRARRESRGVTITPTTSALDFSPTARHVLAFLAALLVNLAVLGTLELSADAARPLPAGEVVVTQLDELGPVRMARN